MTAETKDSSSLKWLVGVAAVVLFFMYGVQSCETGRNMITRDLAETQDKIEALEPGANRNVAFNLIGRAGEGALNGDVSPMEQVKIERIVDEAVADGKINELELIQIANAVSLAVHGVGVTDKDGVHRTIWN